jgi:hypothetical protein
MFTWAEQTAKKPAVMRQLAEDGMLPNFWNEKIKINRQEVLVPYNLLEEANKDAMVDFLKNTETYLKRTEAVKTDKKAIKNQTTKETVYEWNIKTNWENALKPEKAKVINKLSKKP